MTPGSDDVGREAIHALALKWGDGSAPTYSEGYAEWFQNDPDGNGDLAKAAFGISESAMLGRVAGWV